MSLPVINTSTNFTENAGIASCISEINENFHKALNLNSHALRHYCPKAVKCCVTLFKYLNNAAAASSTLVYYEGYHAYLEAECKDSNILEEINNELIDFIKNYRSLLTLNELKDTLIKYRLIEDEEDDELL